MAFRKFDDAVVGAGVIGLAHAYHLARRGRSVIVFERSPLPQGAVGASVRNFGMLWPIGQPAGEMHRLALRSRGHWLDVLSAADLWHERAGSLHLAYRDDEASVLREFITTASEAGADLQWLGPREVISKSPAVNPEGLIGAMWSPTEICVDPREVIASLPAWLSKRYGVQFAFDCAVTAYHDGRVVTGREEIEARRLYCCAGDDLQTLFPAVFRESGLVRCKLQMMRTAPLANDQRIGPMLAAGLTLAHYRSFRECPSLPALERRLAEELPDYVRYGIHVLVSQNGLGELTLGDSHEYGAGISPFDKQEIDELVLRYLKAFLRAPEARIASRWNGVYVKHPEAPYFVARPSEEVTVVTGVGGAGMTLSFGMAEKVIKGTLEEVGDPA
jgi:FAD dependent oxidoreductase TIGR03364